jgi:DNA-directed RNA polymerase beta subunit
MVVMASTNADGVLLPCCTFVFFFCHLQSTGQAKVVCRLCDNSSTGIERVAMPYVFKYLAAELAAMNIKISVGVK